MNNLLFETEEVLKENEKSWSDVCWIGGSSFTISIDNFIKVANKIYDDGFGAPKVAQDLKIVGKDWWLERLEYDGLENWDFKKLPDRPQKERIVERVICEECIGWRDLEDIE